jgi:hypothetical protein
MLCRKHQAAGPSPQAGSSGAAIWVYRWRDWFFAMDRLFNSDLRAGFVNTEGLPNV